MSVRGKASLAIFVVIAFVSGILFTTAGANLFNFGDRVGTDSAAATIGGSHAGVVQRQNISFPS